MNDAEENDLAEKTWAERLLASISVRKRDNLNVPFDSV